MSPCALRLLRHSSRNRPRQHKGKVLQTNLPSEQEGALRDALGDKV